MSTNNLERKCSMRRKKLWKRISYISLAVTMIMTAPAASALWDYAVSAEDITLQLETRQAEQEVIEEETTVSADIPAETNPPATEPPATEAPSTEPPSTEAPETQPPSSEPETEPPATEQPGSETQDSSGDQETSEQEPTESDTPVDTEPETESQSESENGSESESESDKKTETESETEKESESETNEEDHSILNANWKTNIIASNASYLGQLSSAYGISISENFGSVMDAVEQQFAENLTDPTNFRPANWKDVFAVYIYELKRSGSGNASEGSQPLLLDVFTKMNAPEQALGIAPKEVDITEVFVEEYPIEEELIQIDEQEKLLSDVWADIPGALGSYAQMLVEENAQEAKEEQIETQQIKMEQARYEKWLRLKQGQDVQVGRKLENYSTADLVSRTIADYVQMNGLTAADQAEIERYASTEFLQLCAIACAAPQIVRASVGNDVSEERVGIVTAAYSLVGKVGYFWGGKSSAIGWDPAWGTPAKVTAAGSTSSGMTRSYGLDCSGYVQYCYRNGLGGSDAGIGGHTTSQWNASVMVDQVNVQPGDLVFYGGPERGDINHVGVVVGKSADGGLIVAHCSSSRNGVVVGEAWTSGFRYVRTVTALR